jgi:hypothetical protein
MGAFTGQSGSLYTEQKKLGATFENMQAQVGTALLPSVVDLNEALRIMLVNITPYLIESFERLAEILTGIVGVFNDAMDPTTELGESFAALNIQAESLATTMGLENFKFDIFEFGALVIRSVVDLIHDLMRSFEDLVINIQVAGQALNDFFFNREKFDNTDYLAMRQELLAVADGAKDIRLNSVTASDSMKEMLEDVAAADKAKLENLRQQFRGVGISASYAANEARRMREQAGVAVPIKIDKTDTKTDVITGGAKKKPAPSGLAALIADSEKATTLARKRLQLQNKGLSKEVIDWILSTGKPVKAANDALKLISKNAGAAIKRLTDLYNKAAAGRAAATQAIEDAAAEAERLQEERRRAEEARLEEQKRVYESFLDSVKTTFGGIKEAIMGAFDITALGGSTNSIIRNLSKLLAKTRDFAANISKLSTMGLNPALLQQVISAGPMAGAKLAAALVEGGVGALSEINASYGEFGGLASAIATTGTNALFGTQPQQNVYNINVSGGVGSGATIGQAIVEAIKAYERVSGAVWQGA